MRKKVLLSTVSIAMFCMAFLPILATAALTGVSVSNDTSTGTNTNVTISPDYDNTDDNAEIQFTPGITGLARVIINTNGNGTFEPVTWSNFDPKTSTADTTLTFDVESGQVGVARWEGRDIRHNILPNATYAVKIVVDTDGNFATTNDQEVDSTTITITVLTGYIKGRVTDSDGNGIEKVEVRCGGAQGGSDGRTDSNGDYTVAGLVIDSSYHVNVETSRVTSGTYVNANYESQVTAKNTDENGNTGIDFSLSEALQITGTITIPSSFVGKESPWDANRKEYELWLNINAWEPQGPGYAWGNAHIHASDWPSRTQGGDQDNDGTDDVNESLTIATYTLNVSPGTYNMRVEADGYVGSSEASVEVTSQLSPVTKNIVMTEAKKISGSVTLSSASTMGTFIEVSATPTNSSSNDYGWGGGNIAQNSTGGGTSRGQSGYFEIGSILPGTYNVKVRVDGYASYSTTTPITILDSDADMGSIALGTGGRISGTITIQGDTTNYKRFGGDGGSNMNLYIEAFDPSNPVDGFQGTNVQIVRGTNQSAIYTIGGLPTGTFEVHGWLGEGYEPVYQAGEPMFPSATISQEGELVENVNITFGTWSGSITGRVTARDLQKTVNYDGVLIKALKDSWFDGDNMWRNPIAVKPDLNGNYTITGLGTGKYVLLLNEYVASALNEVRQGETEPQWQLQPENDFPASGNFGRLMVPVSVSNGQTKTKNLVLEDGHQIIGSILIDGDDPIFKSADCPSPRALTLSDLSGIMVNAIPIRDMMMGGRSMSNYRQAANMQGSDLAFSLNGLGPGTYSITVDTWLTYGGCQNQQSQIENFNEQETLFASETKVVTITDADVSGVTLTLFDGKNVSGTVTLPETPSAGFDSTNGRFFFHLGIFLDKTGGGEGNFENLTIKDFSSNGETCNEFGQGTACLGDLTSANFTVTHVASGTYMARGFSPNYTEPASSFIVGDTDVSGLNLAFTKGASIIGTLVDADTGAAVKSGVTVFCEAVPWVEGSYRETRSDDWSKSKIDSTTGEFTLANLPAGTYVVEVSNRNMGARTDGSVNYAGTRIGNVVVSSNAVTSGLDVDVGTIRLSRAVTIKGTITDSEGDPIGNVHVLSGPENRHSNAGESDAKTSTDGTYTLYVNPGTNYYEVCAAERPEFMEFMTPEWGEVCRRNVVKGSEDVDFTLQRATASLSGTLTLLTEEGSSTPGTKGFGLPMSFGGDMDNFPAALVLLQNQSQTYSDPMDGIAILSAPSSAKTTSYAINGLVPGIYTIKVFCANYGTSVTKNVTIPGNQGSSIELYEGVTISGSVRKSDGANFTTGEINQVVAFDNTNGSIIFGKLVSNSTTREVTTYTIGGIQGVVTYKLAFMLVGEDGPEGPIMMAGDITSSTTSPHDVVINADEALKPSFVPQVMKNNSDSTFNISLFSSQYLRDADASAMFAVTTGTGSISSPVLLGDKRGITAVYTPGNGDTQFAFQLTVHYGSDSTQLTPKPSFGPYLVGMNQVNAETLNTLTGGDVTIGNGDASGMSFGEGDISDANGSDGQETLTITSSDSVTVASQAFSLAVYGDPLVGSGVDVASVDARSDYYTFSGITLSDNGTATVSLQYDSSTSVADEANLDIYYSTDSGTNWTKLGTAAEVIDTESNTISDSTTVTSAIYVVGYTSAAVTDPVPGIQGVGLVILSFLVVGTAFYKRRLVC